MVQEQAKDKILSFPETITICDAIRQNESEVTHK